MLRWCSQCIIYYLKSILNTILRKENIGEIYRKYKVREIINCDMTKALDQDF